MMLTAIALVALAQQAKLPDYPKDKNGLPFPFALEEERVAKGDHLAPYSFLKDREKEYRASEMWGNSAYPQALGTYASFVGQIQEAHEEFARTPIGRDSGNVLEKNPFEGYKATDAVGFLLKQAERERILMIGEAHHVPQTRVIGIRLLKGLWNRGYRYLAAEALYTKSSPLTDPKMNERTYPIAETGFYTREPVFGDMIRWARKIGFKLVAYEAEGLKELKPEEQPQAREDRQAANLKAIFDADPKAKVLVWNGYSHNSERPDNKGAGVVLMGARFKQITGIDPYTVNLTITSERSKPEYEVPVYRYAADHGLIRNETVFVKDGKAMTMFEGSNDCSVFLPRTKLVNGRPDWLQRELHRYPFEVPETLVVGEGRHLAQAFYGDEPETAIPVDQIVLQPGEKTATLMVPPTSLWIRVLDEKGVASKPMRFRMSALDRDTDEEEEIADYDLANELAHRVEADQAARNRMIGARNRPQASDELKAAEDAVVRIDRENTQWLKGVVARRGWPSRKLVGWTGAHNAWLLVQHADKDVRFQRRALDLMKPLVPRNQVSKIDFAYLTDRVLLAEGKKQKYGTQVSLGPDGKAKLQPTEDRKNLNKRRAALGLETVEEYIKELEKAYRRG